MSHPLTQRLNRMFLLSATNIIFYYVYRCVVFTFTRLPISFNFRIRCWLKYHHTGSLHTNLRGSKHLISPATKNIDSQDTFQTSLILLGQLQSWQRVWKSWAIPALPDIGPTSGQQLGKLGKRVKNPKNVLKTEASPAHWTPYTPSWSSCFSSFMILPVGRIGSLEPQWLELSSSHVRFSKSILPKSPKQTAGSWHPIFKPTHLYLHPHTYGSFSSHGRMPQKITMVVSILSHSHPWLGWVFWIPPRLGETSIHPPIPVPVLRVSAPAAGRRPHSSETGNQPPPPSHCCHCRARWLQRRQAPPRGAGRGCWDGSDGMESPRSMMMHGCSSNQNMVRCGSIWFDVVWCCWMFGDFWLMTVDIIRY